MEIKKGRKSGGVRSKDMTHARIKSPSKGDVTSQTIPDTIPDKPSGPKKGTWSRITQRPNPTNDMDCMDEDIGPKRKDNKLMGGEVLPHAKKFKQEEKSVVQSNVVITHIGSAEVAGQPRQVQ